MTAAGRAGDHEAYHLDYYRDPDLIVRCVHCNQTWPEDEPPPERCLP